MLKKLLTIIKTGSRDDVKKAKEDLAFFWKESKQDRSWYNDFIATPYNRAAFLAALKWGLLYRPLAKQLIINSKMW